MVTDIVAAIALSNLTKRFGSVTAVDRMNLELQEGELIAFLGPSGCGKTTTLRMIAGFEVPDEGRVLLGDRDVTGLPPDRRNTGMVFQNYALFPHMTVFQNVAFGLEMRKLPPHEIRARVTDILARVQLDGLGERYPRQLSGGQQQRAALARALVINPSVLLLDEPLANLDAKLREEMRFYIRSLQQEFGITTIYVTHDQSEALVLADRIAVMMDGRLQQLGAPQDIYRRPASARVAGFIGLTNLIQGQVRQRHGDMAIVETSLGPLSAKAPAEVEPGRNTLVSVRPEILAITPAGGATPSGSGEGPDTDLTSNRLEGRITERAYLGNLIDYRVEAGGVLLRVQAAPSPAYGPGDGVVLSFDASQAWCIADERGAGDGGGTDTGR